MKSLVRALALATILALNLSVSLAVPQSSPASTTSGESPSAGPLPSGGAAPISIRLDPIAETQKRIDRIGGDVRANADAYVEGKYWLSLWNCLYGVAVAWILLSQGVSVRLREIAEKNARRPNVQAWLYGVLFWFVMFGATLPMAAYAEYFREHQYGMSNLSFVEWLGEASAGILVGSYLMSLVVVGLYAILRRAPRTWWAWATVTGGALVGVALMIAPLFIAPLFNTYTPLPEGPLKDDILSMARANGIPVDNVYVFDASKQSDRIDANVSGMFGTTRISLSDNLLHRSSPAAVKAVMGHEMGHYVLNHGPKLVIAFTLILLGGMLFLKFAWDFAFARWGASAGIRDISDPAGFPLIGALLSVYFYLATPLVNTVIRTAETEADLYGFNAAREPDGFAEVFLVAAKAVKLKPSALEEALFFNHPSGYKRIHAAMRWKAENVK